MICEKCKQTLAYEKIITPDGRSFHIFCFEKEDAHFSSGSKIEKYLDEKDKTYYDKEDHK